MNTKLTTRGMHFNDEQLVKVAQKIGKLSKYCKRMKDESSIIRVEADSRDTKKESDQIKMSVSVKLPGTLLRADSRKKDPLEALDRCIAKLESQVKKYKEKHSAKEQSRKIRKK